MGSHSGGTVAAIKSHWYGTPTRLRLSLSITMDGSAGRTLSPLLHFLVGFNPFPGRHRSFRFTEIQLNFGRGTRGRHTQQGRAVGTRSRARPLGSCLPLGLDTLLSLICNSVIVLCRTMSVLSRHGPRTRRRRVFRVLPDSSSGAAPRPHRYACESCKEGEQEDSAHAPCVS